MDFDASATIAADPDLVFEWVQDLTTYPRWFRIVDRVRAATSAADDERWDVDLAARLGPLKRTKRVRMARTLHDLGERNVRFERHEDDGRGHSAWVLEGSVAAHQRGSRVRMRLHYGGVAWLPGLDLLLRDEARRAGGRLERLVVGGDR